MTAPTSLDQIPPLSRVALRHEVVHRLLGPIFRGELPAGTRLVAQKLATRFGISATPIREALLELEAIGVVEFPHNRGGIVKPFGPRQLRDIFHVRRVLEAEATRCACGRLDPPALEALQCEMTALLQNANTPDWFEATMAADRRLHEMIAEGCDNPRLCDEIDRCAMLVQIVREILGNDVEPQMQALGEHLPILDALLAGQADVAATAMAKHIDRTAATIEAIMVKRWNKTA